MASSMTLTDTDSESPYKYSVIKELRVGQIYNVYGVVKSFKAPKVTRSGWSMISLWIVDESCMNEAGETSSFLSCVLFETNKINLPVINVGDIVRFHRLRIFNYAGCLQGKESYGFSWLVVSGNQISHSHDHVTYTPDDRKRIHELRDWMQNSLEYRYASKITRLADIEHKDIWINLTVQVVSVYESNADLSCTIVVAWDSTAPSFMSHCYCPMDKEIGETDKELQRISLGKTVKLFCYDNHHRDASKLASGQMIKLVNIHVKAIDKAAVRAAVHMGFLNEEALDSTETWLALVMHGGTFNGRRIVVLQETEDEYKELNSLILKNSEHEESQSILQPTVEKQTSSKRVSRGEKRKSETEEELVQEGVSDIVALKRAHQFFKRNQHVFSELLHKINPEGLHPQAGK